MTEKKKEKKERKESQIPLIPDACQSEPTISASLATAC